MSSIPISARPDQSARFAAQFKTLARQSHEVLTRHTATGISPDLYVKAMSLEVRIRKAMARLAKKNIGDHVTELNNLNQASDSLVHSTLIPFRTTSMLLDRAAELILKVDSNPKEILAGIMEQGKVKQLLPLIYEKMAALVGTVPGTRSAREHGQALFEDETQDRATKAQALINTAAKCTSPRFLPEEYQEYSRQLYLVAERGRQAEERERQEHPEKIVEQQSPLKALSPLLNTFVKCPLEQLMLVSFANAILHRSQKAKKKPTPVPDLVQPKEQETTTQAEIQPVKIDAPAVIEKGVTPIKTQEEEAEEALQTYRELRTKNHSILTQPETVLSVTVAMPQEPIAQNQHATTENLDAELIALNEQYKAAQQTVDQLRQVEQNNQELIQGLQRQVGIVTRLIENLQELLEIIQRTYNLHNVHAASIEKALEDPKATDVPQLRKTLRDLIPKIVHAQKEAAKTEELLEQRKTQSIDLHTDLNENQRFIAQIRNNIETAEATMFRVPMLIADVQKRKENLEQTRLLEITGQKKEALQQIHAELLKASFWKIHDLALRSGLVIGKFKEKNIPEETQLWIKEYVFAHSEDQMKTKEGNWIEDHIADDLNLIYLALEEAVKKFG